MQLEQLQYTNYIHTALVLVDKISFYNSMSFFTFNKAQSILVPSKRARTLPPEANTNSVKEAFQWYCPDIDFQPFTVIKDLLLDFFTNGGVLTLNTPYFYALDQFELPPEYVTRQGFSTTCEYIKKHYKLNFPPSLNPKAHIHIHSNEVGKMIVENIPKERPAVFTLNKKLDKIIINLQKDNGLQARISAGILIHLAVLELKK